MSRCHDRGLGSSAFDRLYLRNHCCFLFLPLLRCFSSQGLLPDACRDEPRGPGCPIRRSADLRVFAPPRGFSQLITSFFASESQGILYVPLSPFFFPFEIQAALIPKREILTALSVARLFCLRSIMSMCSFQYLRKRLALSCVENNGFEPLTPCLQSRCSSQLS